MAIDNEIKTPRRPRECIGEMTSSFGQSPG